MDDITERLERLARLHEAGALSESEFQAAKAQLLSGGSPAEGVLHWEYKDLVVPLNVWGRVPSELGRDYDRAMREAAIAAGSAASPIITKALRKLGVDGWQADEPTDLRSLVLAGRVRAQQTGGVLFSWKFTFDSATIRLKRLSQTQSAPAQESEYLDVSLLPKEVLKPGTKRCRVCSKIILANKTKCNYCHSSIP